MNKKIISMKELAEILEEYCWNDCLDASCRACPYRNNSVDCDMYIDDNGHCTWGTNHGLALAQEILDKHKKMNVWR